MSDGAVDSEIAAAYQAGCIARRREWTGSKSASLNGARSGAAAPAHAKPNGPS